MTRETSPRLKEDVSPNLVPMIDVMFLLMLFFMLGADMAQRETVDVQLPRANDVRVDPLEEPGPQTTANIHHLDDVACAPRAALACKDVEHWVCSMQGHDYALSDGATKLEQRLRVEATEFLEERAPDTEGPTPSRKRLLVRADRDAPYGCVRTLIEAASRCGMYKVELAAARAAAPLTAR